MLRGIYSATAGMVAEMKRQQSVANNLANVGTIGFKQDGATLSAFPQLDVWRTGPRPAEMGRLGTGVLATGAPLDLSAGPMRATSRTLDLALGGRGFFAVRTAEGDQLTRAGSFQLASDGTLVDPKGNPVLGQDGPIKLPDDNVRVDATGAIFHGEEEVGRLAILDAASPGALAKTGENLLSPTAGTTAVPAEEVEVLQMHLEESNVDGAGAMVEVMAALRAYEAAQRAMKMQDTTLERAIEDVGRA